jgi:general secretion pathway protein E
VTAPSPLFDHCITREYMLRHRVCPSRADTAGQLTLAVSASHNPRAVAAIARLTGLKLDTEQADDSDLDQQIERLATLRDRNDESVSHFVEEDISLEDVRELANQPPVARYVNLLLREAHDAEASDIHLEATRHGMVVRFRLDGVLQPAPEAPRQLQLAVVSRLKAMASLDVTERRRPQDGRIRIRLEERELDLRLATVPTTHGESVVLRLLDRGGRPVGLEQLGMPAALLERTSAAAARPHGMVLVTGPTGSGKTTTLYASLQLRLASSEKIITVEDPVEYHLDGVAQVPVHRQTGVTFATVLRAILRQDPDVVMIGEMRDAETAEIAVQAAMTGHLVLSTLHTNDAIGAIARLADLGVPGYLVAATVEIVVAQRLVRKLCDACAEWYDGDASDAALLADRPLGRVRLRRSVGCAVCRGTGYRGRTGVFEALPITDAMRRLITANADVVALRECAASEGFVPMRRHGWALCESGVTTLEEVLRAVAV